MKIIGLMVTRDDGWCLDHTIRSALKWCDNLVVLFHCPTLLTENRGALLLKEFSDERLTVLMESDPDWNEAQYRQRLLEMGRDVGGTHFAIIDGDESLTLNQHSKIRVYAGTLEPAVCLWAPWICLWRSVHFFRSDNSQFGTARAPLLFRDAPHLSFQPREGNYQIHTRVPVGTQRVDIVGRSDGGLLHFQHVEWRRLIAKQRLYKMVERLRWKRSAEEINQTYDKTIDETGLERSRTPLQWGMIESGRLVFGVAPWQEGECKRLWEENGAEAFRGLNLYFGCPESPFPR